MQKLLQSLFMVGIVTVITCSCAEKKIVNPSDYAFAMGANNSPLTTMVKTKNFWEAKNLQTAHNSTAQSKLAFIHSNLFSATNDYGHLELSDSILHELTVRMPLESSSLYRALASNAMMRHQFWEAKGYIAKALKEGENKPASLYTLADIHIELGNVDSAKAILNSFKNKTTFAWLVRRAKIEDLEGATERAIETMESAVLKAEGNSTLHCWALTNLGDMYGHSNAAQRAYETYLSALHIDATFEHALKGIAWLAFSHDKNPNEAERIINHLLGRKAAPDYWLFKAELADLRRDTSMSIHFIEKFLHTACAVRPDNVYNRLIAFAEIDETGDYKSGLARARREVSIRPTTSSYDLFAWALYKSGDTKQSIEVVETYLEGKTTEPESLYHMGVIHFHCGDREKGRELLSLASESKIELGPATVKEIDVILSVE
jgi:hypothetical protein